MMMNIFSFLVTQGTLTITDYLLTLLRFICLRTRRSSLPRYHHGPNPRTLVSDASDGIGLPFVHELAQHSFNTILHGRKPSKL